MLDPTNNPNGYFIRWTPFVNDGKACEAWDSDLMTAIGKARVIASCPVVAWVIVIDGRHVIWGHFRHQRECVLGCWIPAGMAVRGKGSWKGACYAAREQLDRDTGCVDRQLGGRTGASARRRATGAGVGSPAGELAAVGDGEAR